MPVPDDALQYETELIDLLRQGDDSAYATLYDRYAPMLFGVIRNIVREEADAENLLQDCFVKVWRNIGSYEASKGRLATWLLNIARNTAIDFTRSKIYSQRRKNQSVDSFVSTPMDISETPLLTEAIGLKELVHALPAPCREIIEWMYFKGFTQQEISDNFGLPLGTVKTRTRTALKTLRHFFELE